MSTPIIVALTPEYIRRVALVIESIYQPGAAAEDVLREAMETASFDTHKTTPPAPAELDLFSDLG